MTIRSENLFTATAEIFRKNRKSCLIIVLNALGIQEVDRKRIRQCHRIQSDAGVYSDVRISR